MYAIGGNPEAARRAGISVPTSARGASSSASLTAGIAGVLFASWQASITTKYQGGQHTSCYAVAAAVIGGTSLFGGRGKTLHGVLGGLVIGSIYNGLFLLGVSAEWVDIVVAMVLLAAGTIDVLSRRGAQPRA